MKIYDFNPNNPRSFYLTNEQNQKVFEEEITPWLKELFDFTPKENPTAYITGGLPGAGKTSSIDRFKKESNNSKILIINSDNMRVFHPLYAKAMELFGSSAGLAIYKDASIFAQKLIEYAQNSRIDFIVDTTLRDSNVAKKLLTSLKKSNYKIVVNILVVNKYESLQGIFNRYAKQYRYKPKTARFVEPKYIDIAIPEIINSAKVVENLEVAEFKLLRRNLELLYGANMNKTVEDVIREEIDLKNWDIKSLELLLYIWEDTIKNLQESKVEEDILIRAKDIFKELNQEIIDIIGG